MLKTVVWGGSKEFLSFLETSAGAENIVKKETLQETLEYSLENSAKAMFLLPDYDNSESVLEEFADSCVNKIIDVIASGKTKIYIENYPSFDARDYYIFGAQSRAYPAALGRNSIKLIGDFKDGLGFELLQKRNGVFWQNAKHYEQEIDILAEIRNCLGVHDVVAEDQQCMGIALSRTKTNVYTAMIDFTNFDGNFTLPFENWKKFYSKIFGEILEVDEKKTENAFVSVYSGIGTAKSCGCTRNDDELKQDLEESVKNAVNWHLNSGIMPESDGKKGVYEMVRSFDLKFAKNIRGDASLFTSALFFMAGKYFKNDAWKNVAENILNETLVNRELQITEGKNKGLLKWFSGVKDFGTHIIYATDTARGGNCLFSIYNATGSQEIKERLLMMGEAFLKWFSGDALIPVGWFNYDEWDLETISQCKKTTAPEFYEPIMILMKNLYSISRDDRYREQIIKTADKMAEIYPDFGIGPSHSKNFTLSRVLGVFAIAQSFESGKWTNIIDELLNYFKGLQHSCGGFADGKAYFDEKSLKTDMEFAIGFGPEHGNICDLMYCQNTMLYTLNILQKCKTEGFDKSLAKKMLDKAVDFLINIQIVSEDKTLSGGWMRAYDMDLGEYYGCDKDFAWGAYSILTGWVTGAIPIAFLDLLGMESMY